MLADQTCCGSDTGAIVGARCLAWWLLCLATFDGDGADGPDLGGGAADCSQAMTPADTKPITAKSLRRMPFPLPFPTGKTASGSLILLAQPK
jgi:hypothetical protein